MFVIELGSGKLVIGWLISIPVMPTAVTASSLDDDGESTPREGFLSRIVIFAKQ